MKVPKAHKLPSGSWNLYLRLGGEGISITASTEKECRTKAQRIKAEYLAGLKGEAAAAATVKGIADRYIDERRGVLSPSTIAGYVKIRDRYEHLHSRHPLSVRWQAEASLAARKYSAKTVHNDFGFWASVLRSTGLSVPPIRLPQVIPSERSWLTPEALQAFLDAIKGNKHEMGALLALHGLRRSELLALEKGSVWGGQIYVRGAVVPGEDGMVEKPENKNAASRRAVPVLIPRLQELVDQAPDGKLYQYGPHALYNAINRACEKAKLPKVGVHGLRHSFASLCYHVGLSERQTMALGGWSDPTTMRRIYTHLSEADRDKGAEMLKAYFADGNKNVDENVDDKKQALRP